MQSYKIYSQKYSNLLFDVSHEMD
ncbi:hypothetical protein MUA34_04525 [Staphylococcus delphini]|nr:hypothetical protein [Staphylococcus delphini]UXS38100.1 hypothetical protein MUA34_04525 [Staphylococcus delphini]